MSAARLLLAVLVLLTAAAPASAVQTGVVAGHTDSEHYVEGPAKAHALKAGWANLVINWDHMEPQQGQFEEYAFQYFYDPEIARYRDAGVQVLVTVVDAPAWATGGASPPEGHMAPPEDPAAYADFLRRIASRPAFKGRVAAYEVWQRPNAATHWHPAPKPADYVGLLKAAGAALAEADPAAEVVTGGLDGADVDFLSSLYDAGMTAADFDAVGVHTTTPCRVDMPGAYYREPDGRLGRHAFTGYRELHQETVERGTPREVWMTELGISALTDVCAEGSGAGTRPAGVSEDLQAQFLTQAYRCLAADTYAGPAMWHALQDVSGSLSISRHRTGLFRLDGTERPAAGALLALAAGIAPDPSCGGRVDTISPTVSIAADPAFTGALRIELAAEDAETPVGRMYLTVRKASEPAEAQRQIPGGGTGGRLVLDWGAAAELPLDVPHVITGYAYDEAKNLGGASVTVTRVSSPAHKPGTGAPGATPPPRAVIAAATSATITASAKRGRRAVLQGTLTYAVPAGTRLSGRGRILVEHFDAKKRKWVTANRFTVLASALRRARVLAGGKRRATITKAVKLRGTAKKWRAVFEFDGLDPFQDARAMAQFRAKG